jgi:membrane associated rhomboid family serine protease
VWYVFLFLLSGLGGSLAIMLYVYLDPQSLGTATVGASGAIFGVMAATLIAHRAAGVNVASLAVLIAINLGLGFFVRGISWQAHVGGMVVGAIVAWLLLATRGPRKREARIAAIAAVAAVLVVLSGLYFVAPPQFV